MTKDRKNDFNLEKTPLKNIGSILHVWSITLNDAFYGDAKKSSKRDDEEKLATHILDNTFFFPAIGAYIAIEMLKRTYPNSMSGLDDNKTIKALFENVVFVMYLMSNKKLPKELRDAFQDDMVSYYYDILDNGNPFEVFSHHLLFSQIASSNITTKNVMDIVDFSINELKTMLFQEEFDNEEKSKSDFKFKVKSNHFFNIRGEIINLADSCGVDINILNEHRSLSGQELICKATGFTYDIYDFSERYRLLKILFSKKIK
jgi:hypothetical protein